MRRGSDVVYIKKFSANVKSKRLELGISQEALAELAECHSNYIKRVENGQIDPSLSRANRIAKALNVKLEDLLPKD